MSRLQVDFGGFKIMGAPDLGNTMEGPYLGPSGFSGWDDGVQGRRDAVARVSTHGEYDLPVLRGARVVTMRGVIMARSAYSLGQWRDRLAGVGADGASVRLTVKHHDDSRWSMARVLNASVRDLGQSYSRWLRAEFEIELVCSDPRKYGERRDFTGGTVQVHHMGNFPASPVVTIVGPRAAPYTITGPGNRVVQVNEALTSGQTHRIDFRTGRIFRNNVLQVGVLGKAGFWSIPPGRTSSMSVSSGSMTVSLDDTFM